MLQLFCDCSFHPQRREGFAAILELEGSGPAEPSIDDVQLVFFANTTNTRLELQGVLHALKRLNDGATAEVITDSAAIPNLLTRREGLEISGFTSRGGRALANADLYRELFAQCDRLALRFQWIPGHQPAGERGERERIFAMVDKAARRRLRAHVKERS